MRSWKSITFLIVVLLALFIRTIRLDDIPPAISWDEASVGYNAYSIATTARDEWGKFLPVVFQSFREYKNPVHIYLAAPFVAVFGLRDWAIRLPSAFFGVGLIYLLYVLGKKIFKREVYGLILATAVAISPYSIQFSRFNHELNIALFFFFLGFYAFLKGLEKKEWLTTSVISFGLAFISYNGAKVIVPLFLLLLVILYFKKLKSIRKDLIKPMIVILVFLALIIFNSNLLGVVRARQNTFSPKQIEETQLYQKTGSALFGVLEKVSNQYITHFSYRYLFVSGDVNPRHSSQAVGQFYIADLLFLILGLIGLIRYGIKHRSKEVALILFLAFIAPIPAALVNQAPHAGRAMFMIGSWHMIIAFGVFSVFDYFKNKDVGQAFLLTILSFYLFFFVGFSSFYFSKYASKSAIDWQYGMRQIVEYVALNDKDYNKVFVTKERGQPYIFFLYYLKYPPGMFQKTVVYDSTPASPFNNVLAFGDGKYNFGNWDTVESVPIDGYLYVLTPYEYSGLKYKGDFRIKKLITYPDGSDAFYLVSSY